MKQLKIKILSFSIMMFLIIDKGFAYYTNKTFLQPRPEGVDLPRHYMTFDNLIAKKRERPFGGNVQAAYFYQETESSENIAKYFLLHKDCDCYDPCSTECDPFRDPCPKRSISLKASIPNGTTVGTAKDFDITYAIHAHGFSQQDVDDYNTIGIGLSLGPKQKSYGVDVMYYQAFDNILPSMYLYCDIPLAYVERDIHFKLSGVPTNDFMRGLFDTTSNYFVGNYENKTIPSQGEQGNGQVRLTHTKFNDEKLCVCGIADIDAGIGYRFLDHNSYQASFAFAITIPTGNRAKGEYLFEPIYGNGHHFGFGGDLNACIRLFRHDEHSLKLKLMTQLRYLFEATEKRTLGIKDRGWSQYFLLGKVGQDQLVPAANVLTMNVFVTPGCQFDGMLGLGYTFRGFSFDFGWDVYARENTSVRMKKFCDKYTYAIAARGYDTSDGNGNPRPFVITPENVDGGDIETATITKDIIDVCVAETPSQLTNALYGNVGYVFDGSTVPYMFSVGGKYEWASKNSIGNQWGVWAKIGIGF